MDALHEIMRGDKSEKLKIVNAQRVMIDSLNEVKAMSKLDQNTNSIVFKSRESITTPDVKSYHTDNDELIRTVEEALLIVRQDS
jgi:hypothetical protein